MKFLIPLFGVAFLVALLPFVSLENPPDIPKEPKDCKSVDKHAKAIFYNKANFCPTEFVATLFCAINSERVKKGYNPLHLDDKISQAALEFSTSNHERANHGHWYKLKYSTYGQIAGGTTFSRLRPTVKEDVSLLLEKFKDDQNLIQMPQLSMQDDMTGTNYTEDQWKRTTKFGFSCNTFQSVENGTAKTLVYVVAFFEVPKECPCDTCKDKFSMTEELSVPNNTCSKNLHDAILCRINEVRQKKGYALVTESTEITQSVSKWVSTNREAWGLKPCYGEYGQSAAWRYYASCCQISYRVSEWIEYIKDDFLPSFVPCNHELKFTEEQWKGVTKIGIGCSSYCHPVNAADQNNGKTLYVGIFFNNAPQRMALEACPAETDPVNGVIQINDAELFESAQTQKPYF